MREVSGHDFCKLSLCSHCNIVEVTFDGEVCDTCQWVMKPRQRVVVRQYNKTPKPRRELVSPLKEIVDAKRRSTQLDRPKKRK